MKVERVGWAYRQPLRPAEKAVLIALAWQENNPTIDGIDNLSGLAREAEVSEGVASRAIAWLEASGLIQRPDGGVGRHMLNTARQMTRADAFAMDMRASVGQGGSP